MKADNDIITEFNDRMREFLDSKLNWRKELLESYDLYSGRQWRRDEYLKRMQDGLPIFTVNKFAPVVDAVVGFQIQNKSKVKYIARQLGKPQEGQADIAQDAADFFAEKARAGYEETQAFRDMTISGIGATHSAIVEEENPDGDVSVKRVFPYLLFWDATAKAKNLTDRAWNAVAKITDMTTINELLDDVAEDGEAGAYKPYDSMDNGFAVDSDILDIYEDNQNGNLNLGVIYEYEWREKEPFYRVQNPFELFVEDAEVMNWLGANAEKYKLNIEEPVYNLSVGDFRQFKKDLSEFGIELSYVKQKRYVYYKAILTCGKIIEKSVNYTKFSINFMTGKYDEVRQEFYGMARAIKDPQRIYNRSVSNLQAFLDSVPNGGVMLEVTAVPDIKEFVNTWTAQRDVSVFNDGALRNGQVQNKPASQPSPALLDSLATSSNQILEAGGIDQSFLGVTDSKDMTGVLFAQKVRQALTTLAEYFEALKYYKINQGYIFLDCIRVIAENNPKRVIGKITNSSNAEYLQLMMDDIANDYDVIITDAPQSPAEKEHTFQKLLELVGYMINAGQNAQPIMQTAMNYAPLEPQDKDNIIQGLQPPPPPQPDPLAQAMLEAEVRLKQAQAAKLNAEAAEKTATLQTSQPKEIAEIQKTESETALNYSKIKASELDAIVNIMQ